MPAINTNDLINAKLDADTIAGVATSTGLTVIDRLGNTKNTLAGMSAVISASTAAIVASAAAVQGSLGYLPPVAYAAGISLTLASQTVGYSGQTYAPILSALPFTTSGTFEAAKFRLIQGVSGADLAAPTGSSTIGDIASYSGAYIQTLAELSAESVNLTSYLNPAQRASALAGDLLVDCTSGFIKAAATGRPVKMKRGNYLVNNPNILLTSGFIGEGTLIVTITLTSGTLFQLDAAKYQNVGNFVLVMQSTACKGIRVGGLWHANVHDIYFKGPAVAAPFSCVGLEIGVIGSVAGFGSNTNNFDNLFYENCDEVLDSSSAFVNANTFKSGMMFTGTRLRVANSPFDCHGNNWIGRTFQTCTSVVDAKRQGNALIGCYVENCNVSGFITELACTVSGVTADARLRADRLQLVRLGTGYAGENGAKNLLPSSGPTIVKDERFWPGLGVVIADVDSVSVSGLVQKLACGPGAFGAAVIASNSEITELVRAYGSVTVSFDAINDLGVSGIAEIVSGSFGYPTVSSSVWQRYSYTINNIAGFLKIYVGNSAAGQIRFTNITISAGSIAYLGAKGASPIFVQNTPNAQWSYNATDGFWHGRVFKTLTAITTASPIIDFGSLNISGQFVSAEVTITLLDSSGSVDGYGLYTQRGLVTWSLVVGGDSPAIRGAYAPLATASDVAGLVPPTIAFDKTTGILSIAPGSGACSVYTKIEFFTNTAPNFIY